jgi:glycerophosphoryl diester phosphodiesterase
MSRPLLIAHRGGLEQAPENTMAAFAAAIAGGADGLELDLQLSSRGVLVVRHDPLGEDDDLAALPRLAEVLDLVATRRPDMRIVVDVKASPWSQGGADHGRTLIERAAPLLRAHPAPERIVLGSFAWDVLDHARAVAPEFATAYHTMAARWLAGLTEQQTGVRDRRDYLAYAEAWRQDKGPGFEALSWLDLLKAAGGRIWSCQHRDLTRAAVSHAHALGLAVWTWTVNTEDDLRRVLALGVDAITTDRPQAMLNQMDSMETETRHV